MAEKRSEFLFEDAELIFKNFAGKEDQFNPPGRRNFTVIIPTEELAQQLIDDGWNIKYLKPREEGDPERPCLNVAVRFEPIPPRITMISSQGRTLLTEDIVEMLDYASLKGVDFTITPYSWSAAGKSGIKAYLRNMYVTLDEDELDKKYANVPTAGKSND